MVSWFSFSKNKTEEEVGTPRNVNELDTFQERLVQKDQNELESGSTVNIGTRMRKRAEVSEQVDIRAQYKNVNDISDLEKRFANEFSKADSIMETKSKKVNIPGTYDYEGDRRFQMWKEDKKKINETLHIHWLDSTLDRHTQTLVYALRIFTTMGLCYGIGRSVYLYRTIDRTYAKLNGQPMYKIAFDTIALNVAKGGGVALACSLGLMFGDPVSKMVRVFYTQDVTAPKREWYDVTAAFTTAGVFGGMAFCAMEHDVFSPRGMMMICGASVALGFAIGLYLGYKVYRPFTETREGSAYERPWRKWFDRSIIQVGPSYMRGRYN